MSVLLGMIYWLQNHYFYRSVLKILPIKLFGSFEIVCMVHKRGCNMAVENFKPLPQNCTIILLFVPPLTTNFKQSAGQHYMISVTWKVFQSSFVLKSWRKYVTIFRKQ